jgi:translation elongation factor EF-Tu-like GTPase
MDIDDAELLELVEMEIRLSFYEYDGDNRPVIQVLWWIE